MRQAEHVADLVGERQAEIGKAAPSRADEPVLLYSRAIVAAAQGRQDEALRLAGRLEKNSPPHAMPAHLIAGIHAMLGDRRSALAWLERGSRPDRFRCSTGMP
jgi:hypothetical protein